MYVANLIHPCCLELFDLTLVFFFFCLLSVSADMTLLAISESLLSLVLFLFHLSFYHDLQEQAVVMYAKDTLRSVQHNVVDTSALLASQEAGAEFAVSLPADGAEAGTTPWKQTPELIEQFFSAPHEPAHLPFDRPALTIIPSILSSSSRYGTTAPLPSHSWLNAFNLLQSLSLLFSHHRFVHFQSMLCNSSMPRHLLFWFPQFQLCWLSLMHRKKARTLSTSKRERPCRPGSCHDSLWRWPWWRHSFSFSSTPTDRQKIDEKGREERRTFSIQCFVSDAFDQFLRGALKWKLSWKSSVSLMISLPSSVGVRTRKRQRNSEGRRKEIKIEWLRTQRLCGPWIIEGEREMAERQRDEMEKWEWL